MSRTASRLLSLLSLLQGPRVRSGPELAERLDVTVRTVRHDIERLRDLGYDVDAVRGSAGGYRMGSPGDDGVSPLLLDDDEAIAVAVGLRTGVNCIVGGMEDTSLRALAKLEQVLPTRMRARIQRLNHFIAPMPSSAPMSIVDPSLLLSLVNSCAERRRVRFRYADSEDLAGVEVEPYRLISSGHHWFLLGYDVRAEEWTIHDAEGIDLRTPGGPRFAARRLPADDLEAYVAERVPRAQLWSHLARVVVDAAPEHIRRVLAPAECIVSSGGQGRCDVLVGGTSWRMVAINLLRLDADFTVTDQPELAKEVVRVAEQCRSAVS
ncbi:WYL domain-containing protein [Nocardioides sp. YIM 152315]|uniref:helix-turn-helix transcriptional regulator n=1 Tax=Nocardioides sp. YIM 152315 TaxID=3031760 RepID=UPI0023DC461C|nr:WYL domain-containing protein [Nocardioides sp. YIM 152315]MDF1603827.1 WYL domain-containing protein [Nocardioides sp. YIM 152315]